MTSREAKKIIEENTKKKIGESFDPEVFKRAAAKEARWMKAALGLVDWSCRLSEVGEDYACAYYDESIKKAAPNEKTLNREMLQGR